MSQGDPLDSLEDALFRTVRRERPKSEAVERTATAVLVSFRWRRFQRSLFALGGGMALAAGAALVLWGRPGGESIQAEQIVPKHSVSSAAAAPSVRERLNRAPEPGSDDVASAGTVVADAGDWRTGLTPSVASTTLEEEIVMLDVARSELAAGKAEKALSSLDHYNKVSGGHLTAEATLLRIEALSRSGRKLLAEKLARRVIDSDPNSPFAERARTYIPKQLDPVSPGGAQKP